MQRLFHCVIMVLLFVGISKEASADLTAFFGAHYTSYGLMKTQSKLKSNVDGIALSISFLGVGLEGEYSNSRMNQSAEIPSLRTGMVNLIGHTPTVGRLSFYGTVGGGLYRESLAEHQTTAFGVNVGGGIKVAIFGPIGVRLDYRKFSLGSKALESNRDRAYVGFNLIF